MPIIRITDADDSRIACYRNVPDPEMLRRGRFFVAENRLVVRRLLASPRMHAQSVLVTDAALENMRDALAPFEDDLPIYVCEMALMESISGFNIHRGCLALGDRPHPITAREWLAAHPYARRLLVLEGITNADNVGGLFRTALAFGVDAVLLGPRCCDPLYRKAIRVSIGAALDVPFASSGNWPDDITFFQRAGFTVIALTPASDARDLEDIAGGAPPAARVAVLLGNEGEGLSEEAERRADQRVRIGMVAGVDSLNVNTAAAIALYRLMR